MKIPTRVRENGVKFNLTPMIDIVFLLIIFFLVASYLSRTDNTAALELSRAASAENDRNDTPRRLTVTVTSDKVMHLNGKPISLADFEQVLLIEQGPGEKGGGAKGGAGTKGVNPLEVRIRADHRVPYHTIEPLLVACARAGVTKIKFNVLPKT